MASKLSVDAFLRVIAQSGLLTSEQLEEAMSSLTAAGVDLSSPEGVADALVERETLTRWQADKLLQGKHKGFFLGKYRLLSLLGKGGMSSVYLAEHVLMRRRCAIKVLPAKRVHDTSYLGRFHREAQAVAALDHPNIVRAYDVDQEINKNAEIHFLVMEYVDGSSLQELVRDQGILCYEDAVEYCRQTALGLEHAHAAGMVHRDIKPGNLLVDHNGVVKILDLGLARFFGEGETESLTVAHDEKVLGTADYLAPEQALDSHQVDSRADIYSLGCTLYFMLTGHPPFIDGTLAQRLMSHQRKEPSPITDERPDFPESLDQILKKMMKKEPSERYETAQELADVFADWLNQNAPAEWKAQHPAAVAGKVPVAVVEEESVPEDQNLANFLENLSRENSSIRDRTSPSSKTSLSGEVTTTREPAEQPPRVAKPVQVKPVAARQKESPQQTGGAVETALPKAMPKKTVANPPGKAPSGRDASDTDSPSETSDTKVDANGKRRQPAAAPSRKPGSAKQTGRGGSSKIRSAGTAATVDSGVGVGREGDDSYESENLATASQTHKLTESFITRLDQKKLIIPAGIAIGILIILSLAYFLWPSSDTQTVDNDHPQQNVEPNPFEGEPLPRAITVGAEGDFKSLSAALDVAKTSFQSAGPTDILTITLLPGTYADRIVLDGSGKSYLQNIRIVAKEAGSVTLQPEGDQPVIQISKGRHIVIAGLKVDAAGKPIAVELAGRLEGLRLNDLEISGFTECGIFTTNLNSYLGDAQQIRLTDLKITGDNALSTGIRLASQGNLLTSFLHIKGCRFSGNLSAGLTIAGGSDQVRISESIFAGITRGISFEGEIKHIYDLVIVNNTFYETERPISFAQMPYTPGNELKLFQNLFLKPAVNELRVDSKLTTDQSNEMFHLLTVGNNWSDRPASGPPPAEGQMNIFLNGGKQADLGIELLSTDPASPDYLKPKWKPTLLVRAIPGWPLESKPYAGAVDPRPQVQPKPQPQPPAKNASQAGTNQPANNKPAGNQTKPAPNPK